MNPCKPGKEKNRNGICVKKCEVDEIRNDKDKCIKHRIPILAQPQAIHAQVRQATPNAIRAPSPLNPCKPGKEKNRNNICVKKCEVDEIRNDKDKCVKNKTIKHALRVNAPAPRAIVQAKTNSSITRRIKSIQTRRLKRILARNITKVNKARYQIKAKWLNSICTDAGVCIAFGKEEENIKKFFDGFIDFKYVSGTIDVIGVPSANGIVNEITYEREGYKANAVLKTSANRSADNLMYEYRVGLFINKKLKQFPCFLETYGCLLNFTAKKNLNYLKVKHKNSDILADFKPQQIDWGRACMKSDKLSVLIQHMKGIKGIKSMLSWSTADTNIDLFGILIQVYMPLATMCHEFTHYDLHWDNVQLYEPIPGKYIQYHYHLASGKTISFKSKYLVKIIDYGRCYFHENESSLDVYNAICNAKRCKPNCGYDEGFSWNEPRVAPNNYYISSSLNNVSHDLRLVQIIKQYFKPSDVLNTLKLEYIGASGTPAVERTVANTWRKLGDTVFNVNDMLSFLEEQYPRAIAKNTAHYNNAAALLGTMNVYTNKNLTYVSN